MPNWCANRLIVTGTPDQLTAVAEFSHSEGSDSFFSDVDVAFVQLDDEIQLDFHTRWAPPEGSEIRNLSKRFSCHICHTFCEEGEGFCGYHVYSNGEYIDSASDDIEWSDDLDEYGYAELVGPEYVLGNVPDYGG